MTSILRRILWLWRPHRWLAGGLGLMLVLRAVFTVVLALSKNREEAIDSELRLHAVIE